MKRKYENLMTEHERRVNDKDITAYENYDMNHIYGKLPGFGGSHEANRQQQMVARNFGGGAASPTQVNRNSDVVIQNG